LRASFAIEASSIIKNNSNSVLLLGDIGVHSFKQTLETYPKRSFNIGILEQSMISVGAGFASEGMIPIIHTIAPFMVERAFEQIKIDFGFQKLPGNLVSVGASFDYSKLGCTHHCPGDVNILGNIPGIKIFVPGHSGEFANHFKNNWNSGFLNYFRLSENENDSPIELNYGEIKKLKDGSKGMVLVLGPLLKEVLTGLKDTNIEIHYANTLSDLSLDSIDSKLPGKKLVIVEPFYSGPLFLKIGEELTRRKIQVMQIGVPNKFIDKYGSYSEQLKYLNLDSNSLKKRILEFIR